MKNLMSLFRRVSIRTQILVLMSVVAIPALGIIVYSGITMRNAAVHDARLQTQRLAENIAAEQTNLVTAAQQLMIALAQLPDVQARNRERMSQVLINIQRLSPQYSNILIAGPDGHVWAHAIPGGPSINVSDRRYFQNAMASGGLSSGEYIHSRITTHHTFNIAQAFRNGRGAIDGVIIVGFVLEYYRQALARSGLPPESGFVILDHNGVVLYNTADPKKYIGKLYDAELFSRMKDGPDVHTSSDVIAITGRRSILSYRKLRLPGETSPYLYIRVGVPVGDVLADANRILFRNLAFFTFVLCIAVFVAWFIGRRSIADRITELEAASQKMADGDLDVRISDRVAGGEIGGLGQAFDVMARKLKTREEALVESESSYRNIFNATRDAIFLFNVALEKIAELNSTAIEMFGYSREEIMILDKQNLIAGEPPYTIGEAMDWIFKTVRDGPQNLEWLCRRKNGELFWSEAVLSATQVKGEDYVLVIVRDITERRQAEEEKQKLQAQLYQVQKMESIGRLAGGIAHDFNNILGAIIGYGSLLQEKMKLADPNRTYLNHILASAEMAANLTQSLLAFSRKQIIHPQVMDLNACIAKTETFLTRIIGEDISLKTNLFPGQLPIYADIIQIEQILMNLATNARDAMPGGGDLVIETALADGGVVGIPSADSETGGSYAVIRISDTGEGIDEDIQRRIFEPFFTTKERGGGTGIGLAIVYGIVKQNNGHISVTSKPGNGTSFQIYLPLTEREEAKDAGVAINHAIIGGTETILLAEDNEALREMNTRVLQKFGYTVIAAEDGEKAIREFVQHRDRIDLLVLDVIMPGKNGKEVYDEARRILPRIKAIFTSGYPEDLIARQGALAEGLNFIPKPSPINALLGKIREVLDV